MERNVDEVLQYDDVASGYTVCQLDEPRTCIESIDNDDTTFDPKIGKMEKKNSLGKMFQRLRSSSKKYHLDNTSSFGKLDNPVFSKDDIEVNPEFHQIEKTNSLGKMFQRMRSSNKKVQQKRPSTAVGATNTKGSHFISLLYCLLSLVGFFLHQVSKILYVASGKRIRKFWQMRSQWLKNLKKFTFTRARTSIMQSLRPSMMRNKYILAFIKIFCLGIPLQSALLEL